jgi:hypothetical protein
VFGVTAFDVIQTYVITDVSLDRELCPKRGSGWRVAVADFFA